MQTKRVVIYSLFLALGLILSYVESLIPFFFGVPGMKLGLANTLVVVLLYTLGAKEAMFINVLRILLSGFLFGNAFSIVYSLAGALVSFIVMLFLKQVFKISLLPASVVGAIFHNVGQLLVAVFVMQTAYMLYYLAFLSVSGFVTGLLVGIIATGVIRRLPKDIFQVETTH